MEFDCLGERSPGSWEGLLAATTNSPSQDSFHPEAQVSSRYVTPGFKPFSILQTNLFREKQSRRNAKLLYAPTQPALISSMVVILTAPGFVRVS